MNDPIVDGLVGATDALETRRKIDSLIRKGKLDRVVAVATAIALGGDALAPEWLRRSVLEHLDKTLAFTPGEAQIEALFACANASGLRPPVLAEWMAQAQPLPSLLTALERHRREPACADLCAGLVQELVLRGNDLRQIVAPLDGPLGWLPLAPSPLEANLRQYLPTYRRESSGASLPFGPFRSGGESPHGSAIRASERSDPERAQRIQQGTFEEQPEVRLFDCATPTPEVGGAALASLGLDCLRGSEPQSIRVSAISPSRALTVLLCAAAFGGAYGHGVGTALGRLRAWQALAALADAPLDADFAAAETAVTAARWFWFEADNSWFAHVAWDLAIAAFAGPSLAIVADTSTD